jgi:outer membrane protein insertion porin family
LKEVNVTSREAQSGKDFVLKKGFRPWCLTCVIACVQGLASTALAQTPAQAPPPKPAPQPPAQTQQKQANPFETLPESQPVQPVTPPAAAVPVTPAPGKAPAVVAPKAPVPGSVNLNVVQAIEFRGSRRVPADTLRALIFTKPGDEVNEETLRRDFSALWNTNRFDDIRLESEPGDRGTILRFVMTERPVIRTLKYEGVKSLTTSEILDRFKERKVGLSVESQYDPARVQHAAVVIKEYLSERGRQFATVTPELHRIPPNSLEVVFRIDEGAKVKVGHIEPAGNQVFTNREVIRAMKNLKPIGIPHSLILENLFDRTYDASKLDEDKERVRQAYQDKGYYRATVLDTTVSLRDTGDNQRHPPFFLRDKPGKRADIKIPVEEGQQYHLRKMTYVGVKLFRTPDVLTRQLFGMNDGDIFSTAKLRKGLENMKKLYGDFGYIDFVPEPSVDTVSGTNQVDLTLTADEGKQFFVRRIDFVGNTTTRDKVIRREILLDEGDIYSARLWDASILRLNQLGYFEVLKENESYDIKRNPNSNTIDITLKVKEKGKNSIGLNGGVSGIAGSFVGFNYSTNNFLGLGETLSLESQIGTRLRDVSIGFTEPYFLDRPLQVGVVVYIRRYNYDQATEASILSGQDLRSYYNSLGTSNLLNYTQNSKGVSLSMSYPIRRSFARLALTYGYDNSDIVTRSNGSQQYFEYINFQGVTGPNSLSGIRTSRIVPSFQYNSKNAQLAPTAGKSLFASIDFAGSVLGGNVNTIRPSLDVQYYHYSPLSRKHTLAFHMLGSLLTGYGGRVAPPFQRTYIGGEQDVRGFDFYGISPIAFVASTATVNVLNDDGSPRVQKSIINGVVTNTAVVQSIPTYQIITPGGDTQIVTNFEYRIPILGPVTLAPFVDFGLNKITLTNQLRMNQGRVDQLNGLFPQAGFDGKVKIAPGTQAPRMSTGLELQVMLPVVNAPFRVYYAYNPLLVRRYVQTPIVADRSSFPNNATFLQSIATFGQAYPLIEKHGTFRFTIGRTF